MRATEIAVRSGSTLSAQVLGAGVHLLFALLLARRAEPGLAASSLSLIAGSTVVAVVALRGLQFDVQTKLPLMLSAGELDKAGSLVKSAERAVLRAWWFTLPAGIALLLGYGSNTEPLIAAAVLGPLLGLFRLRAETLKAASRPAVSAWVYYVAAPSFMLVGVWILSIGDTLAFWSVSIAYSASIAIGIVMQSLNFRSAGLTKSDGELVSRANRLWLAILNAGIYAMIYVDIIVADLFIAPASAADGYAIASRIAALVGLPLLAVNAVGVPYLSTGVQSSREALERAVRKLRPLYILPTIIGGGFTIMVAPFLLSLFGEGYSSAAPALRVLVAGHIVSGVLGPVGFILVFGGFARVAALIWIAASALLATVGPLAALWMGPEGLALVTTTLLGATNLALWIAVKVKLRVDTLGRI